MNYLISDIEYDTDGEQIDLPNELNIDVPTDIIDVDNFISDEISNITGFCHKGFTTTPTISLN